MPEGAMIYKGKIGADEIPKESEEHFLSFTVINKYTGETENLAPYGIYSFLFDIYSENTEVLELREDGIPIQEGAVILAFDGTNYTFSTGNDWIFMVSGYGISFNIDIIKDNSTYEIDFKNFNYIPKGAVYTVIEPFVLNDTNYESGTNIFWDGTEWQALLGGGGSFYIKSTDIVLNDAYYGSHSLQSDTVFVELIAHRNGFVQGTMTFSKASLNIGWMGNFLYPWTGQVNGILNITYAGPSTFDIDWNDDGFGSAAANYLTIIEHRFGDA